jgi:hypothetical protein
MDDCWSMALVGFYHLNFHECLGVMREAMMIGFGVMLFLEVVGVAVMMAMEEVGEFVFVVEMDSYGVLEIEK